VKDEALIRLAVFGAVLLAMALWEALAPRRPRTFKRAARWPANLGVSVLDSIAVRLLLPLGAVGFASFCAARGWGLLNAGTTMQYFTLIISIFALDLAIYFQHVMFHAVPALWRVHRTHHSDLDFDVTTGVRFHPIEIVVSMGIKCAAIAALGAPAAGVMAFEVMLNASSMFNHGNVAIPLVADKMIRSLIVTPDMHRVHHSKVVHETNSNFGFNLSWWDRLFGTYRAEPAAGQLGMTIGIEEFSEPRELELGRILLQPWRGATGRYPING
jgi:sterol desaturase/sphingolipid hydroxylase (fatty acid hydroxylase superfamily)